MASLTQTGRSPGLSGRRRTMTADRGFRWATGLAAVLVIAALLGTAIFLVVAAWPSLRHYGLFSFFAHARWAPSEAVTGASARNPYGILQFIYGTLLTSAIGMLIAVPASVAIGLYITQLAPPVIRRPLSSLVDLLAAIPSVVYGFWGLFALRPALQPIGDALTSSLGSIPVIGRAFAGPFFGVSYFIAGLILAIMVLPIVTAICREVFATAPQGEKESAMALGATPWEVIKLAVLPRSRSGIVGASILGFGRAVGETIAVTMVIGNLVLGISTSIFGQGATMPSVIANEFTEATEPFHLQSLFVVGLVLLVIALIINVAGKLIVSRAGKNIG